MEQNLYIYLGIAAAILIAILIYIAIKNKEKRIPGEPTDSDYLQLKLSKTKQGLLGKLAEIVKLSGKIDEDLMDNLEEMLLQADVGVQASGDIIDKLRAEIKLNQIKEPAQIREHLEEIIRNLLLQDYSSEDHFKLGDKKPFIMLFVGVNGVGKTTTIGKLAKRFNEMGKSVLLIAGDTFRAAAVEQLTIWSQRSNASIVKQQQGADPSSVVYDGVMSAVNKKIDVVLIDTAGRQHTKVNLMNELSKIVRTIKKIVPDGPHETLLVVDSTTGQNALMQADNFDKATNLSGIVLTKLDGTAKGGIVIGIKHQMDIPVKLIGVGEAVEDLRDFNVNDFVDAIFE
ncbi:MAG: signal recognition particle-docking protein FtsY [Candidatus Cloacimonetes bacterium]|nr:signal recognition particle-docking protein FtsY [Candidatus Cloacimonadota bacterium]MCF7813221.1 signal recognition particle-docking protein FtsY [Candidatus Cloacimonadota bacterium]MCF7867420.1 signal recognition particle-docking protein FtsY [Candidatus Cloacimonadota bacterium]MCF7882948.1 signal recognition particle-docking protein FtsY [Candidatus Cloacimonadota bacterium]